MAKTKIEWVRNPDGTPGMVWNPVTGCSKVSEGCRNCYAESLARRFRKDFLPWTAPNAAHNVRLHPERLVQPLHWSKPRKVFVNSVSDLFHEQVPDVFITSVMTVMRLAPEHVYQVLTKRAKRMKEYFRERLPIKNLWLGISAEDQPNFDERSKYLLQTPAAKRFVSLEPLLGPIDLRPFKLTVRRWGKMAAGLGWVIVGGESGPGARPMHPDWVRSIRDSCQAAGVPFFFKQWGAWIQNGQIIRGPIREGLSQPIRHERARFLFSDGAEMIRVGKKAAGNELDGRIWEEMPK